MRSSILIVALALAAACRPGNPGSDGGAGGGAGGGDAACTLDLDCGPRARCSEAGACVPRATAPARTTQVLIDDAYRAGTITLGTALLYRAYVTFQDPRLPAEYDGIGAAPEDLTLFGEVQRAWPRLSSAEQARLQPFMVRPSDPASAISRAYTYEVPGGLVDRDPCNTTAECAGWSSNESAHFRVWSCGDALATVRTDLLTDAESLWAPMTTYMGDPVPDTEDNSDAASPKIDVYLVDLNTRRMRDGMCQTIAGQAAGQMVSTAPFAYRPELTSSGFIFLRVAVAMSSDRKHIFEHEFFHVQQQAHSLPATGGWLGEATATWSEWNFLKPDTLVTDTVFARFKNGFLDRVDLPLDATNRAMNNSVSISYDAFIWHYFAEQETSARYVGDVWARVATGGYTEMDYTKAADAELPFADHFADFIVRNLNNDPIDSMGAKTYWQVPNSHFPHPTTSSKLQMKGEVGVAQKVLGTSDLERLSAEYAYVTVAPAAHEVTFDFTGIEGTTLDIELVYKTTPINDFGGWKRRSLRDMRKLVLCRDQGDDAVYEAYIALGNHAWRESAPLTGTWELGGKAFCCPPGQTCWAGTATVDTSITDTLGMKTAHIDANVQWTSDPMSMIPGALSPKGTATFSGTASFVNGCTAALPPTTRNISGGGFLFFNGPSAYVIAGTAVEGDGILEWTQTCSGATSPLPSDAKPWLQSSGLEMYDGGAVLEGMYAPGDGNVYHWHFERQ